MNESAMKEFVSSAYSVLAAELGGSPQTGELSVERSHYVTRDVTALVGITGSLRGLLILGLTRDTALSLVSHMMGQRFEDLDEVAQSGIAELGNVLAGSAVTSLAEMGYECSITPPTVILGSHTVVATPNMERLAVPLLTPFGSIEMQLALRQNGLHP